MTNQIAIITGASAGLGRVFSRKVLANYPQVDEVWLIARRKERLEELAAAFPQRVVRPLVLDLTQASSLSALEELLAREQPTVKILINNAGFEREGLFRAMKPGAIQTIISLNITAMTMLNRLCLPYMAAGSFEIITGSVSSFAPIPYQAVYSASKVYTRFFARAIREEERERGVNVMLFAPGNMATEMNNPATARGTIAKLPYLDLEKETSRALAKAAAGAAIYTPLAFYKTYRVLTKLVPNAWAVKFTNLKKGQA